MMLQCINEGAADYILKPLRKDVLKTMFLVSIIPPYDRYPNLTVDGLLVSMIALALFPSTRMFIHFETNGYHFSLSLFGLRRIFTDTRWKAVIRTL
jgi:hypothetical protein